MVIKISIFIPLIVTLTLVGCGTTMTWKHPTATTSNFYRDKSQCSREAAKTYQFNNNTNISVSSNSSSTIYSSPKSNNGLVTVKDYDLNPKIGLSNSAFARISVQGSRNVYVSDCLKGKGYFEVKTPDGSEEIFIPQTIIR